MVGAAALAVGGAPAVGAAATVGGAAAGVRRTTGERERGRAATDGQECDRGTEQHRRPSSRRGGRLDERRRQVGSRRRARGGHRAEDGRVRGHLRHGLPRRHRGEQVAGLRRRRARGRIDREQPHEHRRERARVLRRVRGLGGDLVQQRVGVVVQPERRHALHGGVERGAEREHVGRGGRGAALRDLRGEERRGARDQSGAGELHVVDRTGHSEVGELDPAVGADEDVARLDVAVHHARGMRRGQPVGHVATDRGNLHRQERPLRPHDGGQGVRRQVLHHQPRPVLVDDDVEHADDVRMLQTGADAALPLEPLAGLLDLRRVGARDGQQFLHRHRPVEQLVGAAPHDTHGADADLLLEAVAVADAEGLTPGRDHAPPSHGWRPTHSVATGTESGLKHVAM